MLELVFKLRVPLQRTDYSALWWMLSLSTLVGLVDVHVSAISIDEQGLSEAPLHLCEVILITPWRLSQPWFPHLVQLCRTPVIYAISTLPFVLTVSCLQRGSRTICSHGGSLAALPDRKIFRIGL